MKKHKKHNKPAVEDEDEDSKNPGSNSQIDNGEDDEEDDDIAQNMTDDQRYYLYKYFEGKQDELGQMLLEEAGVDPNQAKIEFKQGQLQMTIHSTKSNYSKVAERVKELLQKDLKHEIIDVDENEEHFVPCFNDKRFKKNFKKKFEEKYNVLLLEKADVSLNQGNSGYRGGHGGRGGGPGGAHGQRRDPATF